MNDWLLLILVSVPLIAGSIMAIVEVLLRRPDLSSARRLLWAVALVIVPYVSLLAYAVARPGRGRVVGRTASTNSSGTDLDARLTAIEQHVAGLIDDDEYDAVIERTG